MVTESTQRLQVRRARLEESRPKVGAAASEQFVYKAKSFFYDVDAATHPDNVRECVTMPQADAEKRASDLSQLVVAVMARANRRATEFRRLAAENPSLDHDDLVEVLRTLKGRIHVDPIDADLHDTLAWLSRTFVHLASSRFSVQGHLDWDQVSAAFELFSGGDLRSSRPGDSEGEPDSGYYFCFAELG
ncbi:MAG: hypothetical protein AAF517_27325, partial [Planctomycetota bacterium]